MALRVNELTQRVIDAKATLQNEKGALNALLEGQTSAKATANSLLKRQAAGDNAVDAAQVAAAETAYAGYDARISAQRKLVADAEKDVTAAERELAEEQQRIAAEDEALRKAPSSRLAAVTVAPPNAEKDPKRGFAHHTDFLRAVQRANTTGIMDERLRPLATQGSDEQQAGSNPYGGYFVPVGIAPGVLAVSPEADPLAGRMREIPMNAPSVKFNARVDKDHSTSVSGGFRVYRREETTDGTPSRAKFEQVTLTANEEMGVAFATETILSDSPESFIAIIQAGMADEYSAAAMNERINGTGVGERQGALNTPCLIQIAKEAEQAAATIVVENIDKMAARCWRYNQAIWLANPTTRPQLRGLARFVGTGGAPVPYFTQVGEQEFLDGKPIFFTEFCKALGTMGDLVLAVWSEYLNGTYQTEQFAESMHVRFLAAERAFRFYRRNDGQWWWRSALTPRNGDTLSPVVALATR